MREAETDGDARRGLAADVQVFVFLLVPGLSMMSLASAIEPLRALNRLVGRPAYTWRLATLHGGTIEATNGLPLPTQPLEDALVDAEMLLVCGGLRIQLPDERAHLAALRKAARRRIKLGSLSTGAFLLARAGLLDGYRCTIHWENRPAFREEFPDLDCTAAVFEIDRDRLTCSGGTAAMDMMLRLVTERFGAEQARFVANQFHHERIRAPVDEQLGGRQQNLASAPEKLQRAIALMRRRIESPLALRAIADAVATSPRQLERLFLRHVGVSPLRYAMNLKVERARELLLYSNRPITDVAIAAGFNSSAHLGVWCRRIHGVPPSQLRRPVVDSVDREAELGGRDRQPVPEIGSGGAG
jgi:transcriptional regulator GlxA family with amidase domain